MEFVKWSKISRWNKRWEITEKIDGTNGVLFWADSLEGKNTDLCLATFNGMYLFAGSRNRWLTPDADNYGFATWAKANAEELIVLGPGRHYGEWYGKGIQRGYGMDTRRFAMFNTKDPDWIDPDGPKDVDIVPIIYSPTGRDLTSCIEVAMEDLFQRGSRLVPGYHAPEGIVVRNVETSARFKVLLENDDEPKYVRVPEYDSVNCMVLAA